MNFLQNLLAAIANCFTATPNRTYALVNNNTAATTPTGYTGLMRVTNTNNFFNIPADGLKRLHLFYFLGHLISGGQFHKLI